MFSPDPADHPGMKKVLDHWLALPEAEFLNVLNWTPDSILCKVLEEDFEGKLRGRLQSTLTAPAYDKLNKRLFAHKCKHGKGHGRRAA